MFEVVLSNQASKFIKKADKTLAKRLIEKLESIKKIPIGHDSKKIVGRDLFRIRVGDYRILYCVKYDLKKILIDKIDKRSRVYD